MIEVSTRPSQTTALDSKSTQFIEGSGWLIILLLSRCNEKCLFCMVADEIDDSDDVDYQEAAERIMAQPQGTRIEFFGGEPTIYPRFLDLLTLARQRGHSCSIASNLLRFSSKRFTAKVAALDPSQISIRTSLYGDTAEIHDYYTTVHSSYDKTVQGIRNIVDDGFRCLVNIVILHQNYKRLTAMVQLVHSWGVPEIKFGNLVNISTCKAHAVPLNEVRPYLEAAIKISEELGLTVTVEKTPICVASGRIDLISTERFIAGWPRAYDDRGECANCLVRPWCDGLDPAYVEVFGYDGLHCINSVSERVLKGSLESSSEPEMLKMHCVKSETEHLEGDSLYAAIHLVDRVEKNYGRLAVFPKKYVVS